MARKRQRYLFSIRAPLLPPSLVVDTVETGADRLIISAHPAATVSACPICGELSGPIAAVLLTTGLTACAPQHQATPAAVAPSQAPAATASPANHQEMMAHCAEMRQQARSGAQVSADMQRMLTYCQHMDHTMGAQPGRPTPP